MAARDGDEAAFIPPVKRDNMKTKTSAAPGTLRRFVKRV